MKWMKANFIKSPRSMNRYIMNTSKSGEKTILSNSIKTEHSFTQQIFIETCFVLGTVLGSRDIVVTKAGKILALM